MTRPLNSLRLYHKHSKTAIWAVNPNAIIVVLSSLNGKHSMENTPIAATMRTVQVTKNRHGSLNEGFV
jgi:hypothetical protein